MKITTLQLYMEVCGLLFGIKWKETKALVYIHAYLTSISPCCVITRNPTLIMQSQCLCPSIFLSQLQI